MTALVNVIDILRSRITPLGDPDQRIGGEFVFDGSVDQIMESTGDWFETSREEMIACALDADACLTLPVGAEFEIRALYACRGDRGDFGRSPLAEHQRMAWVTAPPVDNPLGAFRTVQGRKTVSDLAKMTARSRLAGNTTHHGWPA